MKLNHLIVVDEAIEKISAITETPYSVLVSALTSVAFDEETAGELKERNAPNEKQVLDPAQARFVCWAGMGLPKGWAESMGLPPERIGDIVWPITDLGTCGPIDAFPTPDQMLCWCPSSEKQAFVAHALNNCYGFDLRQTEE